MTRQELLKYIEKNHSATLAQVGLMAVDTPESLSYVIDDAIRQSNDDKRKTDADRRVAVLIHDRAAMLDMVIEQLEAEPEAAPVTIEEETTDVSNL